MWRQRKYLNFLTPNLYAVFNNVYMYMQYIEDNRFTMNIFKRLPDIDIINTKYMPDGLHPNTECHNDILVPIIFNFLKNLFTS